MSKAPPANTVSFATALRVVVMAAVIGLMVGSPASSDAQPSSAKMQIHNEAEFNRTIVEYVRHKKGWTDDSYTVEFKRYEEKFLVFLVNHNSVYLRNPNLVFPGGDDDSFEIYLNPDTNRVEQEFYFQ